MKATCFLASTCSKSQFCLMTFEQVINYGCFMRMLMLSALRVTLCECSSCLFLRLLYANVHLAGLSVGEFVCLKPFTAPFALAEVSAAQDMVNN